MEHFIVAYYLVVLLVGVAAITRTALMARAHALPFLKPLAFFLGFANLAALAILTSAYVEANLIGVRAGPGHTVYAEVLGSVSRLSQVGIVYTLFAIACGFRGRRLPRSFNMIFSFIAALLLLSYILRGVLPDGSSLQAWIARGQLLVYYGSAPVIIGSVLAVILNARKMQSIAERKAVRVFGTSYLSLYAVFVISRLLRIEPPFSPNSLALLGINLVPFVWLGRLFSDAYLARPPSTEEGEAFERFCGNHGLTSREAGVLKLILRGRSNADIGRELFISTHTVKNHITNIYGKLGVRSRWQLISLFHSGPQERLSAERLPC